jgi:protein disulfide-isomerase A1
VSWINKRTGPPTQSVDAAGLEALIAEPKVAIVYFGEASGDAFKAFETAAGLDDKRAFVTCDDAAAASKHGASTGSVVLFRHFDEPKVTFDGKIDAKALAVFIDDNSVPTLIEFSDDYIEPIF